MRQKIEHCICVSCLNLSYNHTNGPFRFYDLGRGISSDSAVYLFGGTLGQEIKCPILLLPLHTLSQNSDDTTKLALARTNRVYLGEFGQGIKCCPDFA